MLPIFSEGANCQTRDHHRPVPGTDGTDDSDGRVVEFGVGLLIVDEDLWLEFEGGVGAQPGGAGTDLEAGVGSVERLALFA